MTITHESITEHKECLNFNEQMLLEILDVLIDIRAEMQLRRGWRPLIDYSGENIFCEIPYRAARALHNAGVFTFGDLVQMTQEQVLGLTGVGPVAFRKILRALEWRNMRLKQEKKTPTDT